MFALVAAVAAEPLSRAGDGSTILSATDSDHLVASLPIGAALVVGARTVLGVRSIGLFAPVLLALGVLQTGVARGMALVAVSLVLGLAANPMVTRLALPRIARLGILLCIVCAGMQIVGSSAMERAALPVLTISVVIERVWETLEADGLVAAVRLATATATLAAAIAALLTVPVLTELTGRHPGLAIVVGAVAIGAAGSYRGLRIKERRRFEPVLRAETV